MTNCYKSVPSWVSLIWIRWYIFHMLNMYKILLMVVQIRKLKNFQIKIWLILMDKWNIKLCMKTLFLFLFSLGSTNSSCIWFSWAIHWCAICVTSRGNKIYYFVQQYTIMQKYNTANCTRLSSVMHWHDIIWLRWRLIEYQDLNRTVYVKNFQ